MLTVHMHVLVSALIFHGFSLAIHPQVQRTYDVDIVNRDTARRGEVKHITDVCCPKMCHCVATDFYDWETGKNVRTLVIADCSRDPTEELSRVLSEECPYKGYRIVRAKLSSAPCKAIGNILNVIYLDFSENSIQTFSCRGLYSNPLYALNLSHNNIETGVISSDLFMSIEDLDLSYNKMTEVACVITRLLPVKLDLSYNLIKTVSCNISEFPVWNEVPLRILYMTHNQLQTFPCHMLVLPLLEYMNLSHNHIEDMSCNLFNLSALLTLDFSHNKMSAVPCSIGDLWKLQRLDLSYNLIQAVPCNISRIPLQRLNMKHNQLQTFPCNLLVLPYVRYIDLSYNQMEDISFNTINLPAMQVLDLPRLSYLNLNHNNLTTAPSFLGSLPALKTLDLSWNYLKVVMCDILVSPTLEVIQIHHNQLEDIKCNWSTMEPLHSIGLSYNKFKSMPCDLPPQLKVLDLSYNQVHSVPCHFQYAAHNLLVKLTYNGIGTFPCNLTTLTAGHLDLSHNSMHEVACTLPYEQIGLVLDLSYNSFETLPCELSSPSISYLDMSHNNIQTIECNLTDMKSLNGLDLNHNNLGAIPCILTSLPEYFGGRVLRLNHNHIKTLPSCLKDFSKLRVLDLSFNDISIVGHDVFSGHLVETLHTIELNNNNLSTIELGAFRRCRMLEQVFLFNNNLHTMDSWPCHLFAYSEVKVLASNNKLSKFSNSVRAPLISCGLYTGPIAMDGNEIRHIMDVFNGWNVKVNTTDEIHSCMKVFDFSNNPLVCDCVDYHIYTVIRDNRMHYLSKNLICNEPPTLRGLNPASVPLDRFVCNISDKCPEGCLCYDSPHFRNLSVICIGYKGTKMPGQLPELPTDNYWYDLNWKGTRLEEIEYKPYFTKVAEAVFSYNVISQITIDALLSLRNISKLYLEANHLKRLPDNIASVILGRNVQLRLGYNPWVCDCKALAMREWLIRNHLNIQDMKNVKCFFPPHTKGRQMTNVARVQMCSQEGSDTTPILVAILGGVFCLCLIVLTLGCTIQSKYRLRTHERKQWEPMNWDEEVDEGKEFDVFVSYANEDEDYVGGYLIPELEKHGFKVCFHRVHFLAGKSIIDNICECIAKSKKVLAFYSMNYKQSDFGMYEYTLTMQLDVQNGTNRLVTIIDTDLDIENLQIGHSTYLRTHSYVIKDERNLWRNLVYVLPKHKLGAVEAQGGDDEDM